MTSIKLTHGYIVLLVSTYLLTANGKLIVTASTVSEDIASHNIAQISNSLEKPSVILNPYPSTVYDARFSPDGKFIITAFENGTARVWDTSGKLITELKGHQSEVRSASFSPNGKLIITSTGSNSGVWDISGNLLAKIKGGSGSFSFDGKLILTKFSGAELWNTSGKPLAEFKGDKDDRVTSASFSPDAKLIVTAFSSGIVRIWNTSGKMLTEIKGDRYSFKGAIISPNGKLILTTDTARLWDTSGKMLTEIKGRNLSIQSATFSPDSQLIITISLSNIAQVWDTNGNLLTELQGHQGNVTKTSFSPDGQRIATVSNDGTSRLWDITGKLLATFLGHQGNVTKVNFSPDGQRIVTASDDGTARVWNLSGKQLAMLNLDEKIAASPKAEADRLRDLEFYAPNCSLAIKPWEKALKLYQEIADNENQILMFEKLGNTYYCISDYTQAIKFYSQALQIAQKINYYQKQVKSLAHLGNIYNLLADYDTAMKYYNEGLEILDQYQDTQLKAETLQSRGDIYRLQNKYPEAIKDLSQALAIDKNASNIAKTKVNLANIYYSSGDYNKAIEYYNDASKFIPSEASGGLGNVYLALGDIVKAMQLYQQSLAKAQQNEDQEAEGSALNNLANALRQAGKLPEAEEYLRAAIDIWENLRIKLDDANKISIFEKQTRTFRLLQEVLIVQTKISQALEISERGRARAFIDLLTQRLFTNKTEPSKITAPNIENIQQIARNQNATLVQYSIITDEFKINGKQQTKESEIYIWVIKPTGEVSFRKVDLKNFHQKDNIKLIDLLVSRSRQAMGVRSPSIEMVLTPDSAKAETRLKQLHQLLIKPIADLLPIKESDKVIFIPQSSLFLVPFPALQDENGKYLIEQHTILTCPSIQVLDLTHQQRKSLGNSRLIASFQKQDAVVVGNPTMPKVPPAIGEPPQQLLPLPSAEEEAKAIAPILKTQAITGDKATKSAILQLLPKARIIHLATHGLLDDIRGLGSAIALAPSDKDNGLLTAEEIFDRVKLKAELVVLSACDTGRGRITGDGIIGLSRSLISAGTPSVIVSLWSVPDAPTAELMTEFYQNLQKNPDKAVALRNAMLATMKQHRDPKNWAAFTLIGESD
ncbi:CHAT domain-containing protein [Nostoc sp. CALU 1950]|uniref:CHAT domain-containing protein n=1 Tax=Nostoc sp. CALU 1950 TaxID=3104321 RepID=UPI003EB81183